MKEAMEIQAQQIAALAEKLQAPPSSQLVAFPLIAEPVKENKETIGKFSVILLLVLEANVFCKKKDASTS
ncbi:hypothetical protein RJT34_26312 [Clitoria ternatea]|uniref:Uncharacterized protein n=1 Tax=Clitoria ternatea TaxID=43366 RepID=A0AAN9F8P2_CLITE